jgi:spermidine synthase
LTALFFLSGASSLIIESIFGRLLSYTFGNTAHAASTVLAAFLGGLAFGAFCIGIWVDRRQPSLWIYGVLEAFVALYAIVIPRFFALLTNTYVHICHAYHLGPSGLTALRLTLALLVILPASFLMGGTLPAMSRYVASAYSEFEKTVDALYGWNTLGAATGALGSTYFLIPGIGILGSIYVACSANLLIFLCVALLSRRAAQAAPTHQAHSLHATDQPSPLPLPASRMMLLLASFCTGAAALAYEVIWTHIQVFTIGNTVYAFGLTLFVILCGLGLGAQIVSRKFNQPRFWILTLVGSQLLLGLGVFLTIPAWGHVSALFGRGYPRVISFDVFGLSAVAFLGIALLWNNLRRKANHRLWTISLALLAACLAAVAFWAVQISDQIVLALITRAHRAMFFPVVEFMRLLCVFLLLIIPSILLGAAFPLLINLAVGAADKIGSRVGSIYATNTAGAISGSLLTGFFLIPRLGSEATLRCLATCSVILACVFACRLVGRRGPALAASTLSASVVIVLGWSVIPGWDPRVISSAEHTYLQRMFAVDQVLFLREDVAGGMTAVVREKNIRILASNGNFQGSDGHGADWHSWFGLLPMLFVQTPRNALVIGIGTGQTLHTFSLFPFRDLDVAELAPQVRNAAAQWFTSVNGGVLDRDPRVHVSIADGRNFLMLSQTKYDLISTDITSLFIGGQGDLFNRQFYELARAHLSEGGVFQETLPLFYATKDILVALNTVSHVFPYVTYFVQGDRGSILASNQPLACDYLQLRDWDSDPEIRKELRLVQAPGMEALLGDLILDGAAVRKAVSRLPEVSDLPLGFESTDLRPYLEYDSPKSNLFFAANAFENHKFLLQIRAPSAICPGAIYSQFPGKR